MDRIETAVIPPVKLSLFPDEEFRERVRMSFSIRAGKHCIARNENGSIRRISFIGYNALQMQTANTGIIRSAHVHLGANPPSDST
jgi:hypothetical protein